jgi:hypothetical protein
VMPHRPVVHRPVIHRPVIHLGRANGSCIFVFSVL